MEHPLNDPRIVPPAVARAVIARDILGDPCDSCDPQRVGRAVLREHQASAVARVRKALATFGGALLADATGMGKTYVALALLRDARDATVVAPAALRGMWTAALKEAGCRADLVSTESLARRSPRPGVRDLVVVDEAHHFRNPGTRRYAALASLTRGARILLLTATPVHNRPADLSSLLGLFMGPRVASLDDDVLAGCIIHRTANGAESGALPEVVRHPALAFPCDREVAALLDGIPPPVLSRDEGDPGALLGLLLHRLWSSSDTALRAGVRRLAAKAIALRDAFEAGRLPLRADLDLWANADDGLQLAFAELLPPPTAPNDLTVERERVSRHLAALEALLARLTGDSAVDRLRAGALVRLRERHPGSRIIAFTAFAATVHAMWRHLRLQPRTCALTAEGGVIAGGRISRDDALRRFAPRAHGAREPPEAGRIDLIVSTDLLSEGANLQDASVVVHLDLPWTPARLAQRVGRVARMGGVHRQVHEYRFAAPPMAERVLRMWRRLRDKRALEDTLLGGTSAVQQAEALRGVLGAWRSPAGSTRRPVIAAVRAPCAGALLAVQDEEGARLVSFLDGAISTTHAGLLAAARLCEGADAVCDAPALALVHRAFTRWQDERARRRLLAHDDAAAASVRRALLRTISNAVAGCAPHRRHALLAAAAEARESVIGARGAGHAAALASLREPGDDVAAWLGHVAAVAGRDARCLTSAEPVLLAGIAFVPRVHT